MFTSFLRLSVTLHNIISKMWSRMKISVSAKLAEVELKVRVSVILYYCARVGLMCVGYIIHNTHVAGK